jgi:hypothetical protein
MKLVFSEAVATPCAMSTLCGVGVSGIAQTPADLFAAGFLPSAPDLSRFYLGRQLRIPLSEWRATSENRRVLRKAGDLRTANWFGGTPSRSPRSAVRPGSPSPRSALVPGSCHRPVWTVF